MTLFLVLWVWTNLDKEIDPYINVIGTKDDIWSLMCDESVRGDKNWVFDWIVTLEDIFEGYLF